MAGADQAFTSLPTDVSQGQGEVCRPTASGFHPYHASPRTALRQDPLIVGDLFKPRPTERIPMVQPDAAGGAKGPVIRLLRPSRLGDRSVPVAAGGPVA